MVALLACLCLALLAATTLAARSCQRRSAELAALQRAEEEAAAASRHCCITGLANRRRALEWLTDALRQEASRPAVIRIAFVPFAEGISREGKLAHAVAAILERVPLGESLVARLAPGGYILAFDGSGGSAALVTAARNACNALTRLVSDTQRLRVGVALAVGGDTPGSLIERAEQALHVCASAEPVVLAFSDPELRQELDNRTLAAAELAEAISAGRFEPFFQPFVELGSGRILGFEVLARLRDRDGALRLPGEFLPLAEESGLVGAMYFALLRAAASEASKWPAEWSFSLNLSAQQLRDASLVENTVRALLDAGIGPGRLEIEIAEQVLESNPDHALGIVHEFRERGIGVVLDNFGAGRLHLRELARFPFARIKVDPSAVGGGDTEAGLTLGLISAAARHLGVQVLVQGIETYQGAETAQSSGCAIGQGFLFGRPGRETGCFRLEGVLAPVSKRPGYRAA